MAASNRQTVKAIQSLERELSGLEQARINLIAGREHLLVHDDHEQESPRPRELEDLEIAVELGEVTPEEAAAQRAALSNGRLAARLETERLEAALAGVERRIEGTRLRIRHAVTERRCEETEAAWLAAARRQVAVAAQLAERLESAAELVPGLQAARLARSRAETEREAAYRAAGRRPLELALDEPSWLDGLDDLKTLLEEGPSRPFAAGQAASAVAREDWERREDEILAWFERHGCRDDLDVLPPHLRDEANKRLQGRLRAADMIRRRRRSSGDASDSQRRAA
jgi:hypothetical protein